MNYSYRVFYFVGTRDVFSPFLSNRNINPQSDVSNTVMNIHLNTGSCHRGPRDKAKVNIIM